MLTISSGADDKLNFNSKLYRSFTIIEMFEKLGRFFFEMFEKLGRFFLHKKDIP